MRRTALLLGFLLSTSVVFGQSFSDYLKIRKQNQIMDSAGVEALETFVGSKVVEVQGKVKGSLAVDGVESLLLERPEGDYLYVRCKEIPDWLRGNETRARLIIRANRPSEKAAIRAELIGAAPEGEMLSYEMKQARSSRSSNKVSLASLKTPKSSKKWYLPASKATPYYAAFIKNRNKRLTDSEAWRIAIGIVGFSMKYGVDARLIMAMVMCESGFNPNAKSRSGAMGLGQLMPGTAAGMGVGNPYDSIENLNGTVRLVRGHLAKYRQKTGDDFQALILALAAYNAGSGAVKRAGDAVPPYKETQNYVRKVSAIYYQLCGYK